MFTVTGCLYTLDVKRAQIGGKLEESDPKPVNHRAHGIMLNTVTAFVSAPRAATVYEFRGVEKAHASS
eukprot:12166254-Heterocapsa_arctica.AAC.1